MKLSNTPGPYSHLGIHGLWAIEEVAERLGVQVRHVRRLVAERRIPFIKWGHLLRFDPTEVEEWLNASRRAPAARVPAVGVSLAIGQAARRPS